MSRSGCAAELTAIQRFDRNPFLFWRQEHCLRGLLLTFYFRFDLAGYLSILQTRYCGWLKKGVNGA
jgi:hypothetical protein